MKTKDQLLIITNLTNLNYSEIKIKTYREYFVCNLRRTIRTFDKSSYNLCPG